MYSSLLVKSAALTATPGVKDSQVLPIRFVIGVLK